MTGPARFLQRYLAHSQNRGTTTCLPTADSPSEAVPGACHLWNMQTVYEAAGGAAGLLRLASAWCHG